MQMNIIYKSMAAALAALMLSLPAVAGDNKGDIRITDPSFGRSGGVMNVGMGFDLSDLEVRSTGATVLTPMIVHDLDTLKLPSVSIYGRTSWYMSNRNGRMPLGGNEGTVIRYERGLEPVS